MTERLPLIERMPVVKPDVLDEIRSGLRQHGERFFWSIGAEFAQANPQHTPSYEDALRDPPAEVPDATMAGVLLVLKALEAQAKNDGFRLPEIPDPIDPLPALREFLPRAQRSQFRLIDLAYKDILRTNPLLGELVEDIASWAPDELLRIATQSQVKRGAVWAFYGVKSLI